MLLGATGCVTSPPIIADKTACSALIPDSMRDPVPGADAPRTVQRDVLTPDADDIERLEAEVRQLRGQLREWTGFGVGQTGQLAKANDESAAKLAIIERCEERDRAAIEAARPKFLGIF